MGGQRGLLLAAWSVACAGSGGSVKAARPAAAQEPAREGQVALNQRMTDMASAGDAVVATQGAAPGDAELRFEAGLLHLHAVMQPRFGPANAQLFGQRDQRVRRLGQVLKVEPRTPAWAALLDGLFEEVERLREAARAKGWRVEEGPSHTGGLGWWPRLPAWRVTVTDPGRTLAWTPPYAELARGGGAPTLRNPSISISLVPRQTLHTSLSMVERQQPATLAAATPHAMVLIQQPALSGDVDDGSLMPAVLSALLGLTHPLAAGEKPGVQDGRATQAPTAPPPGVFVVLLHQRQGMEVTTTAHPVGR